MIKTILTLAATIFLFTSPVNGEERTFYDRNGSYSGSSRSQGIGSAFYDRSGRFNGSSHTQGNTTTFYDRNGRYQGQTTRRKQ